MTIMPRIRDAAIILGLMLTVVFQAAPAFAQTPPPTGGGKSLQSTLQPGLDNAAPDELKGDRDLSKMIGRVISSVLGLLGVVLFGYFLYAGFLWMTAGGEPKKAELAMAHIKNAVIGLVIIILAYSASNFVIERLSLVISGK